MYFQPRFKSETTCSGSGKRWSQVWNPGLSALRAQAPCTSAGPVAYLYAAFFIFSYVCVFIFQLCSREIQEGFAGGNVLSKTLNKENLSRL